MDSIAASIGWRRSRSSVRSSNLPRVIRETSSRSSSRRFMCRAWRSITAWQWRIVGESGPRWISVVAFITADSGLRSSCDSIAMNCSRRRVLSSAWASRYSILCSRRCARSVFSSRSSAIFCWYAASTAYSSSLTACSSSFVRCSSSFVRCSSSLVTCSSSFDVSSSSIVASSVSRVDASSAGGGIPHSMRARSRGAWTAAVSASTRPPAALDVDDAARAVAARCRTARPRPPVRPRPARASGRTCRSAA